MLLYVYRTVCYYYDVIEICIIRTLTLNILRSSVCFLSDNAFPIVRQDVLQSVLYRETFQPCYIPYTGKFSRAKIFADRWFRVFRGKYFRGLNTSTGNETSMHLTQSTSTRRLGTMLGHFSFHIAFMNM